MAPELPLALRGGGAFPFVPRPAAWDVLATSWAAAIAGSRELVLIGGEAGAGKSRLVAEFARTVHAGGGAVLHGACTEPPLQPYQPFAEALAALLAEPDALGAAARTRLAGLGGGALGYLVPAYVSVGPPAPAGDPDAERFRLFSSVAAALRELVRDRPLLLILEDLHWAGATTTGLLAALVRGMAPGRLCVLAPYRSTPADASPAFRSALGELRRHPGVARILLPGFDRAEVTSFVQGASGHPVHVGLSGVVDVLAEQTSGNPLLLGELWRHLVDAGLLVRPQGRWRLQGPIEDVPSPAGVQEMVGARVARLPEPSRQALEVASVIGPAFALPLLAGVLERDLAEVLDSLAPALAAGLVSEDARGTARFSHALVRRAIYDTLPLGVRARAHAAVGRRLRAADSDGSVAEIAHHLIAGQPLVEPSEALAAARRAADDAAERVAHDEAARFLEAVLPAADPGLARGQLLLEAAGAAMLAGAVEVAEDRSLEAVEIGRRIGDARLVAAAALSLGQANWRTSGRRKLVERVLADALPGATGADRIRLQAAHGRALALAGRGEEAATEVRAAVADARMLAEPAVLADTLLAVLFLPWAPSTLDEQIAAARELVELGIATGKPDWELPALDMLLSRLITAGNLDEVRVLTTRHRELATGRAQPFFQVLDLQLAALLALGEGRVAEAEAHTEATVELGRFLSDDTASGGHGVLMFGIRREQGRLEEARPMIQAVARLGQEGSTWRPALAVLYAELGMLDEARREVALLVADGLAAVPRDSLWPAALSYLADACVLTADAAAAQALYEHLLPYRGLVVQVGHFLGAYGAADRYLGMLAALLGRDREAEQHFETALRIDTRAQMPVWAARTHLAFGRFLAGRGGAAARERAASLLGIAAERAERLGLAGVAVAAGEELARVHGARPAPTGVSVGLTARELAVLALLVEGRSNKSIGELLQISHHTAANHVRSILMKTDCGNRTEAAGWAIRTGLASP